LTAQVHAVDLPAVHLRRFGIATALSLAQLDAAVEVQGSLHDPVARASVDAQGILSGRSERIGVALRASYEKRRGQAELRTLLQGAPLLVVEAQTELDGRRLIAEMNWTDVPLAIEATMPSYDLARLSGLSGEIAGAATIRGTLGSPVGEADLHGRQLATPELRFGTVDAHAVFDASGLVAMLDATEQPSGSLHLSLRVPRASDALPAIKLQADQLTLAVPPIGPLHELRGKFDGELVVGGTREAPLIEGRLKVQSGTLGVAGDPRRYEDLNVDLTADEGRITLQQLSVKVGTGSLTAHGSLELAGLRPSEVDLQLDAEQFPFQRDNLRAWLDARLKLHGRMEGQTLRGELTLTRGSARLPRLSGTRRLHSTARLEDVVFSDEETRPTPSPAERANVPPSINLVAHIPGPFQVRSPQLRTDLKGQIDVLLVAGMPQLFGDIEASGGEVELLGRRYQIERARVAFGHAGDVNPTLDVRITRRAEDTTVVIELHGTAQKPELEVSSDPPRYDQSQLVGLIVSGDASSARTDSRATQQAMAGSLSGLLMDQIREQILPGLPVDVVRVEPGSDPSQFGLGTTRVEIGKYITNRIYLGYGYQFGAAVARSNANEVTVEYRFRRHYRLATRFGDAGVASLSFYWSLRF
jgi:translocation and assembly module TamB